MLDNRIEKRLTKNRGYGLFAKEFIPKGTIVGTLDTNEKQYTLEELEQLPEEVEHLDYQFGDRYIISHDGGEYMNHSCDPNTWWVSDTELAAMRDIKEGEEITYDYVTADVSPEYTASWECNCGAANCRHRISSRDYLNKEWQKKYKGHLPSWVCKFVSENKEHD